MPKIGHRVEQPVEIKLTFPLHDTSYSDTNANGILDTQDTWQAPQWIDSNNNGYPDPSDKIGNPKTEPVPIDNMIYLCHDGAPNLTYVIRHSDDNGSSYSWITHNAYLERGLGYRDKLTFKSGLQIFLSGDYDEKTGVCSYNFTEAGAAVDAENNIKLTTIRYDGTVLERTISPDGKIVKTSTRDVNREDCKAGETLPLAGLYPDLKFAIIKDTVTQIALNSDLTYTVDFVDDKSKPARAIISSTAILLIQGDKKFTVLGENELYDLIPKLYSFEQT